MSVLNFNLMKPFAMLLGHLVGNRVFAVAGTAVDAGAKHKMRARIVRLTKQLVDIASAIADVDTTRRIAQQRGRLPQIVHPAHTLLVRSEEHTSELQSL